MRVFNNLNKLTVLLCLIVVMCVLVLCASCICSKPVKRCTSESFVSKSNNGEEPTACEPVCGFCNSKSPNNACGMCSSDHDCGGSRWARQYCTEYGSMDTGCG